MERLPNHIGFSPQEQFDTADGPCIGTLPFEQNINYIGKGMPDNFPGAPYAQDFRRSFGQRLVDLVVRLAGPSRRIAETSAQPRYTQQQIEQTMEERKQIKDLYNTCIQAHPAEGRNIIQHEKLAQAHYPQDPEKAAVLSEKLQKWEAVISQYHDIYKRPSRRIKEEVINPLERELRGLGIFPLILKEALNESDTPDYAHYEPQPPEEPPVD